MIDAPEAHGPDRPSSELQLTPISGLVLGLAVSAGLWVGMVEMVRLIARL
jgi:hypothetical protein